MATDSVSSQITIGQPHLAKQDISKLVNKKFYGYLFNHVLFLQYGGTVSFFITVSYDMSVFCVRIYQS